MRNYSITKAATWWIIFGLTGTLFLLLMNSCSDRYELVQPQTLRYEIKGGDYYAVAYEKGAPGYAYMQSDYKEIKDGYEVSASIGDSVNLVVMAGGVPWRVEHASVVLLLGTDTVYSGNTSDREGLLYIHGRLGKQLFVEIKK